MNLKMGKLQLQIKKIAKNHVGQGGRKGALFEKGSMGEGIIPGELKKGSLKLKRRVMCCVCICC